MIEMLPCVTCHKADGVLLCESLVICAVELESMVTDELGVPFVAAAACLCLAVPADLRALGDILLALG